MPGIVGIISRQNPEICERLVQQMIASMKYEKFYVSGSYAAVDLGVFGGWVALERSFADCQPITNERQDVILILAGECFSDSSQRDRLQKRGDACDRNNASWIVGLYEAIGEDVFSQLNGSFSGLLIDRRQHRAFLFNDRYGLERLYYHHGRHGFYFASEAKALLRILPALRAFDSDGLTQFLEYGCTVDGTTLFRGIQLFPAASVWTFSGGDRWQPRRYFTPAEWESQSPLSVDAFDTEFDTTFTRILPRYFDGDDGVGVSLTGGLDTRMMMACRPETSHPLVSFTFAGGPIETLDAALAARVAAACRIPHHTIRIDDRFFADFASLADRTVYITDGCLGICGTHEIYLNGHARDIAAVRLTGNFGSELLRGVTTLKPLRLAKHLFDGRHGHSAGGCPQRARSTANPIAFAAFTEVPFHLFGTMKAAQSQVQWRTPFMDNELVALAFRAPMKTRRSPAAPALRMIRKHDAELSLIPTDQGLIPASPASSRLRRLQHRLAFKLDYWYGEGMPHWLAPVDRYLSSSLRFQPWSPGRHRYLHYGRWFRKELKQFMRQRLTDWAMYGSAVCNRAAAERIANDHTDSRRNYVREIDAIITLETIDRLLLKQPSDSIG